MTPRLTPRQAALAAVLVFGVPALLVLVLWLAQRAGRQHPADAASAVYITAVDGRRLRIDAGWVP